MGGLKNTIQAGGNKRGASCFQVPIGRIPGHLSQGSQGQEEVSVHPGPTPVTSQRLKLAIVAVGHKVLNAAEALVIFQGGCRKHTESFFGIIVGFIFNI